MALKHHNPDPDKNQYYDRRQIYCAALFNIEINATLL